MQLDSKVAIVTGADSGIGRAIALQLAREGAAVVINFAQHEDLPMPGNVPYCCAKGGMRMLTRTICLELAPYITGSTYLIDGGLTMNSGAL